MRNIQDGKKRVERRKREGGWKGFRNYLVLLCCRRGCKEAEEERC